MRGDIYAEYVQFGEQRLYVGMPGPARCKQMSLTGDGGFHLDFRNRRAMLVWLLEACPTADVCATDGKVSLCAGTVANLAERAGIKPKPKKRAAKRKQQPSREKFMDDADPGALCAGFGW